MAQDPNLFQICQICQSEHTANAFSVENGLLPRISGAFDYTNRPPCEFTPNCEGSLYMVTYRGS